MMRRLGLKMMVFMVVSTFAFIKVMQMIMQFRNAIDSMMNIM